jgi:calcineurin-like phosphoesterase family protein
LRIINATIWSYSTLKCHDIRAMGKHLREHNATRRDLSHRCCSSRPHAGGNPDRARQEFCIQGIFHDHWRILAVDTGYNSIGWPLLEYIFQPSCALRPELIDWLRNVVRPRKDDPRGTIILSHHQVYSRYDYWYPEQARQLAEFFTGPVLWFWGHEHRLAIYREHTVRGGISAFGRCIGHGGMPVDLPPAQPKHAECIIEFTDDRPYPNDENLTIGFNGYAELSLQDKQATVSYVDVRGKRIFSEAWVVNNDVLQREHVLNAADRPQG